MIKRTLLTLLLCGVIFTCSGCATILGGIIGHQSGELCAGLAIGAAIDFGDDIVRGIGQMTAKQENLQKDFREKSTFDVKKGEITIPINPFSKGRVICLTKKLENRFEQNHWTCQRIKKTMKTPLLGPSRWEEVWQCKTAQADPEQTFELRIDFRSNRNTVIHIKLTPHSTEQTAAVTSQIYDWLEQIVTGPCNST